MKVIVNVSGFYGGTWFDAKREPQDMPDAVAKAFHPPYGDQLALPPAAKPVEDRKPAKPRAVKQDETKAG